MARTPQTEKAATKALNAAIKANNPEFDAVAATQLEIDLLQLHISTGMTAEDRQQAEVTIALLQRYGRRFDDSTPNRKPLQQRAA